MPIGPSLRTRHFTFVAAFILAVASMPTGAADRPAGEPSLSYSIKPDGSAHSFHVEIRVDGTPEQVVELRMPSWQPASYALQPYAGAASNVDARDIAGRALTLEKNDASAWHVNANGRPFVLIYDLDLSDRQKLYSKSYAYETVGALQAAGTLLYLPAHRDARVRLSLDLPESWTVATALSGGPREFVAADYDELVDSPVLFGVLKSVEFAVRGIPISAAFDARLGFDTGELSTSLSKIADLEISMFGSAPFDRYTFLYLMTPDPSGNGDDSLAVGIEHARSTLITLDPLLARAPIGLRDVVAETNAHELFHAWNVKAIHPESLHRPDYASAPRVRSLWLLEGVTSYVADRVVATLAQDHAAAELRLRTDLATDVESRDRAPSLEQISVDAPSSGLETLTPVYVRGEGVGLLLDVEMRAATNNRIGLDDVLRALYRRSRNGTVPFREEDLARLFSDEAGHDLSEFFRRYIAGSEPLPSARVLAMAGWRVGDVPTAGLARSSTTRALVSNDHATPLERRIQSSILTVSPVETVAR